MIDKKLAAYLYGYGFKLVDKDGSYYTIDSVSNYELTICRIMAYEDMEIRFNKIGKDYFILARDMSMLTQNIEGVGVPLVELLKIIHPCKDYNDKYGIIEVDSSGYPRAYYKYRANIEVRIRPNQITYEPAWIIDKLDELHFSHRLPPGTWKPIEEPKI